MLGALSLSQIILVEEGFKFEREISEIFCSDIFMRGPYFNAGLYPGFAI